MAAGWIPKGPDQPIDPQANAQPPGNGIEGGGDWVPVGEDQPMERPPAPKPVSAIEDTRGIYQKTRDVLFGHDPAVGDEDQTRDPGILPSIQAGAKQSQDALTDWATKGPAWSSLASAYPHILKAQGEQLGAGVSETRGASQVQSAEQQIAALNVLPQAAARAQQKAGGGIVPPEVLAKDPLVDKTARSLGLDPKVFAGMWANYSGLPPEKQADLAKQAQETLASGKDNITSGKNSRAQAWADERAWEPADLLNGKVDPWTLKGLAFQVAVAVPDMLAVAGATTVGSALGGPAGGIAAGAGTAAALFAPAQRADVKNKIDDQVSRLLDRADELDAQAPLGQKRALNPVTTQMRQQAADLDASSDKIANTAGVLYAVADSAGATPLSAVLSKAPGGQAILNRILGSTIMQTAGGRVAGAAIANGAGGVLQTSLQKAVDVGIVHENQSLADALKDIAYSGVSSAITALPIAGVHEATVGRAQTQARRDFDTDAFAAQAQRAAAGGPLGGGATPADTGPFPGYRWDPNAPNPGARATGGNKTGAWVPTDGTDGASAGTKPAISGTVQPQAETNAGPGATRQAYQDKIDTLNAAAAKAEKRSDVTMQPEEEGWSIHVNGEQVATFDTAANAREALAQARKLVGTAPIEAPGGVGSPARQDVPADQRPRPASAAAPTQPTETAMGNNSGISRPVPETPLEKTQTIDVQPATDRRQNPALRGRVDQMTPEQMKAALLTHELTSIPNRRAYEESDKKPAQVSVDVDSLKWMNDNAGHPAGDALLKAAAAALHSVSGGNTYHISGDEFVVQGDSPEHAESIMAAAKARLADATLTFAHPDGRTVTLKGIGLSHGTSNTLQGAETELAQSKSSRQQQGLRAARGEQPPGASVGAPEAGIQTEAGRAAAGAGLPGGGGTSRQTEVLGQRVQAPAVPTEGQAASGNYFKPTVKWHGLPIRIENEPGSVRPFRHGDGSKGQRTMLNHYGYFAGREGADGDGVDVFMGPAKSADSGKAYVIDQLRPDGSFDEHKVVVGVGSAREAKELYFANYQKGWGGLGAITPMDHGDLREWLSHGDLSQPLAWKPTVEKRRNGPDARHDSVLQYLARHGKGLDGAEAERQVIDPADMKLAAAHVGIRRAFRKGGMSFDQAAEHLHEAGYPVADEHGNYSPNVLLDRLSDELSGHPHYSSHNQKATDELAQAELERITNVKAALSQAEVDRLTSEQLDARMAALEAEEERLAIQAEHATDAEDLDAIPFAKQADLFGAQDHIKNELKKLELAKDKKRNSGQESLETGRPDDLFSQARQQVDLDDIKEPQSSYAIADRPAGKKQLSNQLDIFAPREATPAAAAAKQAALVLRERTKLVQVGTFRSGHAKIDTWQQAAHVLAPLRKGAQEVMAGLVLDKDGKPLSVIRAGMGTINGASVEPWSLSGAIASVPGATQVYFAHNHPSGRLIHSDADNRITAKLGELLDAMGIQTHGMIVLTPNGSHASYVPVADQFGEGNRGLIAAAGKTLVPVPFNDRRVLGRTKETHGVLGREISGFAGARRAVTDAANETPTGVLLINNAHQVTGILPMERRHMATLRMSSGSPGAWQILRAAHEANANNVIPYGSNAAGVKNVMKFARVASLSPMDGFVKDSDGDFRSLREMGKDPSGETFNRLGGGTGGGMSVADVRSHVDRVLEGFRTKPDVVVVRDQAALAKIPELQGRLDPGAIALFDPRSSKIYIAANEMHSPEHVASILAHEFVVHYGMRAAFGNRRAAEYQDILKGVEKALPAETRARFEQAFRGKDFAKATLGQRLIAAEEALAYTDEANVNGEDISKPVRGLLERLYTMLRDWLRNVLGMAPRFDSLFVRRTLDDLRTFLRKGHIDAAGFSANEASRPASARPQDTFYSGLARAVDAAKREKGTGAEWEATLRNMPGVKQEEMEWTGIKDWLAGQGRVSKAQVAEYVNAHRVQLGEVKLGMGNRGAKDAEAIRTWFVHNGDIDAMDPNTMEDLSREIDRAVGGDPRAIGGLEAQGVPEHLLAGFYETSGADVDGPTKFYEYATPGGENYREMLMTLESQHPGVEARKPIFDKYADRLKDLYDKAMDITNSHEPDWEKNRQAAAREANRLSEQRDAEADRVFRVPERYKSGHWDEPNVIAHVRFDDRTGANGERVLHIHEIQSDWHQAGRKYGYLDPMRPTSRDLYDAAATAMRKLDNLGFDGPGQALASVASHFGDWKTRWDTSDATPHDIAAIEDFARARLAEPAPAGWGNTDVNARAVPEAPFKTSWPELAFKRMLRMAVEGGYDAISWDTGPTNADRYNLRKVVDRISYEPDIGHLIGFKGATVNTNIDDGVGGVVTRPAGNGRMQQVLNQEGVKPEKLPDYIGKEATEKLLATQRGGDGYHTLSGEQLEVGGAGMSGFYDRQLPSTVNKLVKKWGTSVQPGSVLGALAHGGTRSIVDDHGGVSFTDQHEQIPTHLVRITPAMRDSVLGGLPMFRKKGASTTPPAPKGPGPIRKGYEVARRVAQLIPNNEFTMSFRRIVDPSGVSDPAKATAIVTRENLGELAQAKQEALNHLEDYAKAFDQLPVKDRYEFIDAMERGAKQPNPELQQAADTIRGMLDDWREKVRELGVGALDNWIENYFPHIWQDPKGAKKVFGQIFGRRPMKGPASFLKQRTIPTTKEGLDKGLKPVSSNPLILAYAKIVEMQRFVAGVKLMQRFKDEGLAKYFPVTKPIPEGWTKIDDAVGRVRQWSETEQGFIERGFYAMPTDAARVINNHLGRSALQGFLPADIFKVGSNAVNAMQLGFSAFHLGFTTLDAIVSKNALGIERLLHGEPLRAASAFLEANGVVTGPIMNLRRGYKLLQAYTDIAGATPEMRQLVNALMAAGGRVRMDNSFQAARGISPFKGTGFATLAGEVRAAMALSSGKMAEIGKVVGGFPQQYATRLWRDLESMWHEMQWPVINVPLEIAGRMVRASTSLIMEHIVPMQKLGVFSDLASDYLRRNPEAPPVAVAAEMQRIWDSVDNRLGEMVYDNVFWDRTFKDVNHMSVRAVGWNLGTVRELGGAPVDAVKLLDYIARGAPPEAAGIGLDNSKQALLDYEAAKSTMTRIADKVGHKIPYAIALIGTAMIVGAVLNRLMSGQWPDEIKDYFFPWTGRMTKYGTKERLSIPSYVKDLFEYATQPLTTIANKANPIFGILHAIYANEDFYGTPIRHADASLWQQLKEGAQYALRESAPFSLQGGKQFAGAGTDDMRGKLLTAAPYLGLTPAPARITSPEQMDRYQHEEEERGWVRGLNRQMKAARERGDAAEVVRLRAELQQAKQKEKATEREIKQDRAKAHAAAAKISQIIQGKPKEEAVKALSEAGMPAFATLWRSLPDQLRPRVAESLGAYV